jgi:hypothetical protein
MPDLNQPTSDSPRERRAAVRSAAVHNAIVGRGTFFGLGRRGAPAMRIRSWLKKAESCRRTFVVVEERSEAQRKAEAARAADARHGLLGFAGRNAP